MSNRIHNMQEVADQISAYGFSSRCIQNLRAYLEFGAGEKFYRFEPSDESVLLEIESAGLHVHVHLDIERGRAVVFDYSPSTDNRYQIAEFEDDDFARGMNVCIRVNGRGNAWPLELGAPCSPRHSLLVRQSQEYANTSCSLLGIEGNAANGALKWEILFDIGQGVVPFLIQQNNRLPDAVILSHPHYDHVSGLDWLVQSYKRHKPEGCRLPVFTSKPCWDNVLSRYSYLQSGIEFQELIPGRSQSVKEIPGLSLTGFPVFHGDYAPGAALILVEYSEKNRLPRKAILTGDLLCPLLRQEDVDRLQDAEVMYVDANTRFPWPDSGHWSITRHDPGQTCSSATLDAWSKRLYPSYLITPHVRTFEEATHAYFDQFLAQTYAGAALYWSILDFAERIQPRHVQLVHYSGYEDLRYHKQAILTDEELLAWTQEAAHTLAAVAWSVPKPADCFPLRGRP